MAPSNVAPLSKGVAALGEILTLPGHHKPLWPYRARDLFYFYRPIISTSRL